MRNNFSEAETLAMAIAGFVVFSVCCAWGSHGAHRRKRFIDDLPRSKVRGVFVGTVEIGGTVECATPLTSFLAESVCVRYGYTVEEHWSRTVTESYTDSNGKRKTRTRRESGWKTVNSGGEAIPFFVRDDTGALLVRPDGAEILDACVFSQTCTRSDALYYDKGPAWAVSDSDHRRRFTEYAIPLGASVEVIGQARERRDVVAAEIAADEGAPMFLITMKPLEKVASRANLRGHCFFWFIPVALAVIAGVFLKNNEPMPAGLLAGGLALHLFFWALGWVWNVYNSLADLRNRVRQAWAQVDVLLQLRADLIPNLVTCVSAMKGHEAAVQESLALLRGQLSATPPGQPGGDFDGVSARVVACVEAYPEILSDAAFTALSQGLSDCEARLALARGYFNDIATAYNTRLAQFPGNLAAGAFGFQPRALWLAENLSRAPVGVSF